jgi:hypothetical protein
MVSYMQTQRSTQQPGLSVTLFSCTSRPSKWFRMSCQHKDDDDDKTSVYPSTDVKIILRGLWTCEIVWNSSEWWIFRFCMKWYESYWLWSFGLCRWLRFGGKLCLHLQAEVSDQTVGRLCRWRTASRLTSLWKRRIYSKTLVTTYKTTRQRHTTEDNDRHLYTCEISNLRAYKIWFGISAHLPRQSYLVSLTVSLWHKSQTVNNF